MPQAHPIIKSNRIMKECFSVLLIIIQAHKGPAVFMTEQAHERGEALAGDKNAVGPSKLDREPHRMDTHHTAAIGPFLIYGVHGLPRYRLKAR